MPLPRRNRYRQSGYCRCCNRIVVDAIAIVCWIFCPAWNVSFLYPPTFRLSSFLLRRKLWFLTRDTAVTALLQVSLSSETFFLRGNNQFKRLYRKVEEFWKERNELLQDSYGSAACVSAHLSTAGCHDQFADRLLALAHEHAFSHFSHALCFEIVAFSFRIFYSTFYSL